MIAGLNALFSSEHVIHRSENPPALGVFVSPVLISSSTNRRVDHFHPTRYLSHGIFLLHAAKKNNNAAKFFVFEAKQFGRMHWRTIIILSFKKGLNICKSVVR